MSRRDRKEPIFAYAEARLLGEHGIPQDNSRGRREFLGIMAAQGEARRDAVGALKNDQTPESRPDGTAT